MATLYHCGVRALGLSADLTARQNIQCIHDWAAGIEDWERRVVSAPTSPPRQPPVDATKFVRDVTRVLRRDMCLTTAVYGLTLVLMGLALPSEVLGIQSPSPGTVVISFAATCSLPDAIQLSFQLVLDEAVDARKLDLLYALAPALGTFLRAHGGFASEMPRAHVLPVLPGPMVDAAAAVTKGFAGDALAAARRALRCTGFHVPDLSYISLSGGTLEWWLDMHENVVASAAALEERVMERVSTMKRQLDEDMRGVLDMLRSSRRRLLVGLLAGPSALP